MATTKIERKVVWDGLYWGPRADPEEDPGQSVRIIAIVRTTKGWFGSSSKSEFIAEIEGKTVDAMGDARWQVWNERSDDYFLKEFGKALVKACPELPPEPHVLWSGKMEADMNRVSAMKSKYRIVNSSEGFILEVWDRTDGLGNDVWDKRSATPADIFEAFGLWGLTQLESSQNK